MIPVNSIGPLLEILSKRMSEISSRRSQKGKSASVISKQAPLANLESIRQQILEALSQISQEEDQSQQKAMRVFLEKILLWRFGHGLASDPVFHGLLDELTVEMLNNSIVLEGLVKIMGVKINK